MGRDINKEKVGRGEEGNRILNLEEIGNLEHKKRENGEVKGKEGKKENMGHLRK